MNYKEFALKLLAEQIQGFYDPQTKTLFIASWISADEQKPVMVHELDHALQDQYFDLEKICKDDLLLHNDDRALAHQALFEGDATIVMLLQASKRTFSQLPDLGVEDNSCRACKTSLRY